VAEAPRVLILADDLIWADRLARAVAASGAVSVAVGTRAAFDPGLVDADAAIIDLTARAYDGIAAVESATAVGVRVLAVGQHDDHATRKRALAAGADRVLAYRKLFENGPDTIAAFLARGAPPASTPA
jgi:DNA-binding NarL/FixJ family response regulator